MTIEILPDPDEGNQPHCPQCLQVIRYDLCDPGDPYGWDEYFCDNCDIEVDHDKVEYH